MKQNTNLIYAEKHYKFFDKVVLKKRLEIIKIINREIEKDERRIKREKKDKEKAKKTREVSNNE